MVSAHRDCTSRSCCWRQHPPCVRLHKLCGNRVQRPNSSFASSCSPCLRWTWFLSPQNTERGPVKGRNTNLSCCLALLALAELLGISQSRIWGFPNCSSWLLGRAGRCLQEMWVTVCCWPAFVRNGHKKEKGNGQMGAGAGWDGALLTRNSPRQAGWPSALRGPSPACTD